MELLELGKSPIKPDAPAGTEAKYEPEYEQLEAEIAKLSSPTSSGSLDWKKVQELATTILAEKSKDLMAACYLTAALLKNRQLEGLATGLTVMNDLMKTFWEDLYPAKKRMRGRKNAVEWLFARVESALQDYKGPPVPEAKHKALLDQLGELDTFLAANMEDAPYARPVKDLIENLPVQSAAAPAAPDAPRPAGAAETVSEVANPQDAQKAITAGLKQLRLAANFFLEQDQSVPGIYIINRMAAWMPIPAVPPSENGATKIPPPPDQVKSVMQNLAAGGDSVNLLKSAEAKVNQFLFWLDLSRWVYESLGRLGSNYEAAQEAVAHETAAFVKRLKGVESLSFADGTPFADADTLKWLAEISAGEGGPGAAAAAPADSEEATVAQAFKNADALARDKKLAEAVGVLQAGLGAAASGRSRMMWRMALCQLLLNHKKDQTARPHLDQLLTDIESYKLGDWDPKLAIQGFKIVFQGLAGQKDPDSVARSGRALDSISRLDPGEALKFDRK
ncbi:MAG TPA: type VI secretion system protein TssA [bacterium]|nr:type VI secretion system protein TssA [bacterium]